MQAVVAGTSDSVIRIIHENPTLLMTSKLPILHFAMTNYRDDVFKILLEAGFNPNFSDENGTTPLHVVSLAGNNAAKAITRLLQYGADKSMVNSDGETPLKIFQERVKSYKNLSRMFGFQRDDDIEYAL